VFVNEEPGDLVDEVLLVLTHRVSGRALKGAGNVGNRVEPDLRRTVPEPLLAVLKRVVLPIAPDAGKSPDVRRVRDLPMAQELLT
jgi:hypothetical protein